MTVSLRPPATPLIANDPYFSVWSFTDNLYGDATKHWTGEENSLCGIAFVDGKPYRFCGQDPVGLTSTLPEMVQTSFRMTALSTGYTFVAPGVELKVTFTSPLLPDDLKLLSTPVTFISFDAICTDGATHDLSIYFDVSAQLCVDTAGQKAIGHKQHQFGIELLKMGNEEQHPLSVSGDNKRIDWGTVCLAFPESIHAQAGFVTASEKLAFIQTGHLESEPDKGPLQVADSGLSAAVVIDFMTLSPAECSHRCVTVSYDDGGKSICYFNKALSSYWMKDEQSFESHLAKIMSEEDSIMNRCNSFDKELYEQALSCGGEYYADILVLTYRQAVAGHKLVNDEKEGVLFFSKECFSNGCIATCDVSYPSMPLFLLVNPVLVKGMLQPVFQYAGTEKWPYEFAPHDLGQYPLANGQVYGLKDGVQQENMQMPVEECGNMLIMTCAYEKVSGDVEFVRANLPLLRQWADYLVKIGVDPNEQLCTDDFAGHLAHNCNLSAKGILGIASFAMLCKAVDEDDAERYQVCAETLAKQWIEGASSSDHTRLTFCDESSWSLKYNLIWDQLLGINLFPSELKEKEAKWYSSVSNKFGPPLDNRATYSKVDWQVWAASLTEDENLFRELIKSLWDFANETTSRVPLTDWFDTVNGEMITYPDENGKQIGFTARTVVGGVFIRLLQSRLSEKE